VLALTAAYPLGVGVAPGNPNRRRPTPADLDAARGREIPDVIARDLAVLFCGINPGLWSAATGHHFARPGNRFWPALSASGFTPRVLDPSEQDELLAFRLGITNLVGRGTARADELSATELVAGAQVLTEKAKRWRPRWIAVLGVTAYRSAFGRRDAVVGRQPDRLVGSGLWILPNPSGLNAHWTTPRLTEAFRELCEAGSRPRDGRV